jgi:hypothetical protein
MAISYAPRGGGGTGIFGSGSGSSGIVAEVFTDDQGRYSHTFDADPAQGDYWVHCATAPKHLGPISEVQIWPGHDNAVPFEQIKEAFILLHIQNTSPYDIDDFFSYYFSIGPSDNFIGRSINYKTLVKVGGDIQLFLWYSILKNNKETNKIDTLYVASGDTLYHYIAY